MFNITLFAQGRVTPDPLTLSASGHTLIINGEPLDLSVIPEGATLPRAAVACELLVSDIERKDGMLHLSLILPVGLNAPPEVWSPDPIIVTGDGPISLPNGFPDQPQPEAAA